MKYLVLVILCFIIGCGSRVSEKQLKEFRMYAFKNGVCYTIKIQDEEKVRVSKCKTYGDVAELAWEKYMLDEGLKFLAEKKK